MTQQGLGIGGHNRTDCKEDWLTPPEILAALGEFDLDPCSPMPRPWDTARKHYTVADNGLTQPWAGRVWLNPPYGTKTNLWMRALADHGNGIALIFARTETGIFFPWVWDRADAVLFLKGRLTFYTKAGERAPHNGGAPSVLIAYGQNNVNSLMNCGIAGRLVMLDNRMGAAA